MLIRLSLRTCTLRVHVIQTGIWHLEASTHLYMALYLSWHKGAGIWSRRTRVRDWKRLQDIGLPTCFTVPVFPASVTKHSRPCASSTLYEARRRETQPGSRRLKTTLKFLRLCGCCLLTETRIPKIMLLYFRDKARQSLQRNRVPSPLDCFHLLSAS